MSFLISGRSVTDPSVALSASSIERGSYAAAQTQPENPAAPAAHSDGIAEPQAQLPHVSSALRDGASENSLLYTERDAIYPVADGFGLRYTNALRTADALASDVARIVATQ